MVVLKEEHKLIANRMLLQKFPPLKHALMSLPYWALLVLHYGNMWGLFFLLTAAPKFMAEVSCEDSMN